MKVIPSRDGLLQMMNYEILKNLEHYALFIEEENDFVGQLENYIYKRSYGSNIIDLILFSISNTLRLSINIFELHNGSYTLFNMKSIHPRDEAPLCNIDVVRHSDHFNSISIIG